MAHILAAIGNATPAACAAIVPESLLHSQLDQHGRRLLVQGYTFDVCDRLKSTTFAGARANAAIVRLLRRSSTIATAVESPPPAQDELSVELVRGGLPVHLARTSQRGVPYIHSTDIRRMSTGKATKLRRVHPIERGLVDGYVILVPRVGVPSREACLPIFLDAPHQLSDCVIALRFSNNKNSRQAAKAIRKNWSEFEALWNGTGAKYIAVRGLAVWVREAL
jgi:hypothetical protein